MAAGGYLTKTPKTAALLALAGAAVVLTVAGLVFPFDLTTFRTETIVTRVRASGGGCPGAC